MHMLTVATATERALQRQHGDNVRVSAMPCRCDGRSVEKEVEWLYAFDVHCNAYIPGFIILHGVQV